MTLALTLFGSFQAIDEGRPLTFATNAARALLAYLAVETGQPHSREMLSALFWPDQPQITAYANLRQTVARLRKALPDSANTILQTTQQTIQFNHAAVELDVLRFEQLLTECAAHAHADIARCPDCAARLQQATALYDGEFLQGLSIEQSQPFEEWLLFKRESLHRQMLTSLHTLTRHYEMAGDYARMGDAAAHQLAVDPWREEAHAQMMIALAHQGDRAAALRQYETCRRVLMAELGIEPNPELRTLRDNLAKENGAPGFANAITTTMPPVAPTHAAHNLPNQPTPFVGRENELGEIAALMQEPVVRLMTLVGMGGLGKTRLSIEAAHAQLSHFRDGVYFVSLAALSDAAAIPSAIVAAIGLSLPGKAIDTELAQWLREKNLLLVLDNFEHLLKGSAFIATLLQSAPQVKIIVTSRESLNLRGEHVYSLQGMSYQSEASLADAAHLSAVRLFVQSARQTHSTFRLDETNFRAVLRICELVQGSPLGIELAAAWLHMLPLDDIAAEIIRSRDFLAQEWHDAPERHRSMRAVFNGSWQLLSADERTIFRQLSVFRGGFNHAAAQAVLGASLTILMRLVRKSLIRWNDSAGSVGRYEIHELLRQFATEQLDARPDERFQIEARHSEYFLAFATAREKRLGRHEPREAANEINGELDNVDKAWLWASAHLRLRDLNRAAYALWQFYLLKGLPRMGQMAFHQAVELMESHPIPAHVESSPTHAFEAEYSNVLSKLLAIEANFAPSLGQPDLAIRMAQRAIGLIVADKDQTTSIESKAISLEVWGHALCRKDDPEQAQAVLAQALLCSQQPQNSAGAEIESLYETEFLALVWLMRASELQNDNTAARSHIQQALRLCQRLQKRRGEALCLLNLAGISLEEYDFVTAQPLYNQVVVLTHELGYRWGEAVARFELGMVMCGLRNYGEAIPLFEQAQLLLNEIGDTFQLKLAASHFAQLYCFLGDFAQAHTQLDKCALLMTADETDETLFGHFMASALLAYSQKEYRQAHIYSVNAIQHCYRDADSLEMARAWLWAGHTLLAMHQFDEASAAYERSYKTCLALGRSDIGAAPCAGLAQVALARGDLAQAQYLAEQVLAVLAEHPRAGWDEPFEVYLTCVCVLQANHDPRATAVLIRAHVLLQDYASHMQDSRLRQSFLDNVTVHHEIQMAYANLAIPDPS